MKKIILFFVGCFVCSLAWTQWTTPNAAGNIYNTNTGYVGIGTTNPVNALHVAGHVAAASYNSTGVIAGFVQSWADNAIIWKSGNSNNGLRFGSASDLQATGWSEKMRITDAGYVGIGTTTPSAMLEVANENSGNASLRVGVKSNMANTNAQILNSLAAIGSDGTTITSVGSVAWDYYNNGSPSWAGTLMLHTGKAVTGSYCGVPAGNQGTLIFDNVSSGVIATNGANLYISPSAVVSTSFLANGNVGIGTTNPGTNKLAVEGTIAARKVVVTATNPFPDYVFQPSYNLPSLDSVAQFLQANHHLPEIPSADSVAKNGLDLGGNQVVLLKKIEELTLYTIELQKKVEMLETQNKEMTTFQQQIDELKALLKK